MAGNIDKICIFAREGRLKMMKDLLNRRNCDSMDTMGRTPLMSAVLGDAYNCAKYLLEDMRVNPNTAGRTGECPMHIAAQRNNCEMIKLLHMYKADIDIATTGDKFTPLMMAAQKGQTEAVEALLVLGADTEPKYRRGLTALELAKNGNFYDIVVLIRNQSSSNQPRPQRTRSNGETVMPPPTPTLRTVVSSNRTTKQQAALQVRRSPTPPIVEPLQRLDSGRSSISIGSSSVQEAFEEEWRRIDKAKGNLADRENKLNKQFDDLMEAKRQLAAEREQFEKEKKQFDEEKEKFERKKAELEMKYRGLNQRLKEEYQQLKEGLIDEFDDFKRDLELDVEKTQAMMVSRAQKMDRMRQEVSASKRELAVEKRTFEEAKKEFESSLSGDRLRLYNLKQEEAKVKADKESLKQEKKKLATERQALNKQRESLMELTKHLAADPSTSRSQQSAKTRRN